MKKLVSIILIINCVQTFGQTWQQIGPSGGYFKEFAFHPTNPSIIFAGSDDGGGVWKSINGGQDWNLLTANFPNMTGWSITIDPLSPNTIYVCDVYSRHGLLKSTDGGNTWSQIVNGLSSQYDRMVSGIAIKSSDTLFISTGEGANTDPPRPGNGIFKSFNGGNSWTQTGLQDTTVLSIGSNVFGTIFAGTESDGLKYSNDNGATWFNHPQIPTTSGINEIEVQDSVIALASTAGIYLSTNWGVNFTNTGLAGNFNFDVFIQSISPTIELWSTTFSGLQRYSSASSAWTIISDPLINNKLVIGIGARDTNVFIGTFSNGPIYLSDDNGVSWSATNTSPVCTEINDFIIDPNNPSRILTCLLGTYNIGGSFNDQCIYETMNNGLSWVRKGPNAHALCLTQNPLKFNSCYLGTFSQGLYKTSDGFNSYVNLIGGNKWIADVAVSGADTNIVLVAEFDLDLIQFSIKRSIDGGNNFNVVSNQPVNRLLFNPFDNDTIYAATTNGIILSSDYGLTWNPWQIIGNNIQSLGYFDDTLYAGTDTGQLYRIAGNNASNISGNWAVPVEIKSIYKNGTNLFVGLNGAEKDTTNILNGGVWRSNNGGASWTDVTLDMTSTNVYGHNVIESVNADLLVATYGGGIFKSSNLILNLNELGQLDEHLIQVYPNPVQDILNINADECIKSYVLVDINGRIIKYKVVNQYFNSELNVNLSDVETGVYTLLIQLENNKTIANKVYKQ